MGTSEVGQWGEDQAALYLSQRRLEIVSRHFQTRWGEIDLVARTGDTWVFVEVKTRTGIHEPSAVDAITPAKQKKLILAALSYMKKYRLDGENMRFDVLLIEAGRVEWIQSAFDASGTAFTF